MATDHDPADEYDVNAFDLTIQPQRAELEDDEAIEADGLDRGGLDSRTLMGRAISRLDLCDHEEIVGLSDRVHRHWRAVQQLCGMFPSLAEQIIAGIMDYAQLNTSRSRSTAAQVRGTNAAPRIWFDDEAQANQGRHVSAEERRQTEARLKSLNALLQSAIESEKNGEYLERETALIELSDALGSLQMSNGYIEQVSINLFALEKQISKVFIDLGNAINAHAKRRVNNLSFTDACELILNPRAANCVDAISVALKANEKRLDGISAILGISVVGSLRQTVVLCNEIKQYCTARNTMLTAIMKFLWSRKPFSRDSDIDLEWYQNSSLEVMRTMLDYRRTTHITTFARTKVMGQQMIVRRQTDVVEKPTSGLNYLSRLCDIEQRLSQTLNTTAVPIAKITAAFNAEQAMQNRRVLSEDAVTAVLRTRGTLSLDVHHDADADDSSVSLEFLNLDDTDSDLSLPELAAEESITTRRLAFAMSVIKDPQTLDVIRYLHGLDGYPELTKLEIARKLGLKSQTVVSHIYKEALEAMQRFLKIEVRKEETDGRGSRRSYS